MLSIAALISKPIFSASEPALVYPHAAAHSETRYMNAGCQQPDSDAVSESPKDAEARVSVSARRMVGIRGLVHALWGILWL
jgi:hypothetical protein